MNLTDVFGVNVEERYRRWFRDVYVPEFRKRYPDKDITAIILNNEDAVELLNYWSEPLNDMLIMLHTGDEEAAEAPGGTKDNVEGKLRFVLRVGQDSVEAEDALVHLVLPGDFPYEGAGIHEGFIGGVSGLKKEDDWKEYERLVDKLIEMLREVCSAAVAKANELRAQEDAPAGVKYLKDIDVSDQFPEPSTEAEDESDQTTEAASTS